MRSAKIWCPHMLILVLFSLAMTDVARAGIVIGPIYDPFSNEDLYVVPKGDWNTAESEAQSLGGNLVTIHSAAENTFIVNNVLQDFTGQGGPNLSNIPLWIGLYDPTGAVHDDGSGGPNSEHAANFVWVDGSTSS